MIVPWISRLTGPEMEKLKAMVTTCLIAESDPFMANLLRRFAEESGLNCSRAGAGQEIEPIVRRLHPTVLIVEPELPGKVRGWEAVQALQKDPATAPMAVISCSWLSRAESCELLGNVTAHLQKPDLCYADFVEAIAAAGVAIED